MERGNLTVDVKGNLQVEEPTRKNTNATVRGGTVCSSDEASVIEVEQRDCVIRLNSEANSQFEDEQKKTAKSYPITKKMVWEAYKQVKANKGGAGIDDVTLDEFDLNLGKNLYKIWNRMASGSYFPPPVKRLGIPKKQGGTRYLGIPTISDRIAQQVVKTFMEPALDQCFHADSFGYRPNKSAIQAISVAKVRCWKYDYVVEFDIKGAFDNIDHGLLMKAICYHIKDKWVITYLQRWLAAPTETNGKIVWNQGIGVPQGGVVSPILMNLFMHYAFDQWMARKYPELPFERYADDALVHCSTKQQAESLLEEIAKRLKECHLELHQLKSKVVYCKDSNRKANYASTFFTFLGFDFRPREVRSKQGRNFIGFTPAASDKALTKVRKEIKSWKLHRQTGTSLQELANKYNPIIRGWIEYYGAFNRSSLYKLSTYINLRLSRWVQCKFEKLKRHKRKSRHWLGKVAKSYPTLFHHWKIFGIPSAG
jgi:group II intron reverse transcriptase/maturase